MTHKQYDEAWQTELAALATRYLAVLDRRRAPGSDLDGTEAEMVEIEARYAELARLGRESPQLRHAPDPALAMRLHVFSEIDRAKKAVDILDSLVR